MFIYMKSSIVHYNRKAKQQVRHVSLKADANVTSLASSLCFHWFEVNGWHCTDQLHRFGLNETGVLLVPSSPLKKQSPHKHSVLSNDDTKS